ncbi:MAG: GNAT family N-acetyltransferase [Devosia sp.]
MRGGYRLDFVRDDAGFLALRPEWEELFGDALDGGPYLDFNWCWIIWQRIQLRLPDALYIAVIREAGRIVLIAPLLLIRNGLMARIDALGTVLPQNTNILVRQGMDTETIVAHLLGGIARRNPLGRLRLHRLRGSSLLAVTLFRRLDSGRGLMTIEADLSQGYESYFATLSAATRSHHRRMLKQMSQRGAVRFSVGSTNNFRADLNWLLESKRKWKPRKGRLRGWLREKGALNDFKQLAHDGARNGRCVLGTLWVGDRRAAAIAAFVGGGEAALYVAAYDPAFADFSPGRTVILLMLEHLAALGLQRADFMAGESELKLRLGRPGPPLRRVDVPLAKWR